MIALFDFYIRKVINNLKYTNDEFKDKIYELVGLEYTVLSEFKGMKIKFLIRHENCGIEFEPVPYEFITQGTRCPKCVRKDKILGLSEFKNRVKEMTNDSYIVIGNYINNRTNILMKHKECSQTFSPNPASFLSGTRCPYCSGRRSNKETFIKKLKNIVGDEYLLVGEYKNANTKVELYHTKCKEIYKVKPTNFIMTGYRCPKCAHKEAGKKIRKSPEEFEDELKCIYNGQFIPIERYTTSHVAIKVLHKHCGETFKVKPYALLNQERGCPKCSQSQPECELEEILINLNVKYIRQFKFDDCKGKRNSKLPFDFAVLNKDDTLLALIEYDGQQHFMPSFGEDNFKRTKINDKIKNEYCKKNNIKLLRIPYQERRNMEIIISEFITSIK